MYKNNLEKYVSTTKKSIKSLIKLTWSQNTWKPAYCRKVNMLYLVLRIALHFCLALGTWWRRHGEDDPLEPHPMHNSWNSQYIIRKHDHLNSLLMGIARLWLLQTWMLKTPLYWIVASNFTCSQISLICIQSIQHKKVVQNVI